MQNLQPRPSQLPSNESDLEDARNILSLLESKLETCDLSETGKLAVSNPSGASMLRGMTKKLCQRFTQLKAFAACSCDLESLLSKRAISIVRRYGHEKAPETASRIALRCTCNALLLAEPTRQIFVNQGWVIKSIDLMRVRIRALNFPLYAY